MVHSFGTSGKVHRNAKKEWLLPVAAFSFLFMRREEKEMPPLKRWDMNLKTFLSFRTLYFPLPFIKFNKTKETKVESFRKNPNDGQSLRI